MGILSKLKALFTRRRKETQLPTKPIAKPIQPQLIRPPPPKERHWEIVLHNSVTRKGKSRTRDTEKLELRRIVNADSSEAAIQKALDEMRHDLGSDTWQQLTENAHIDRHISASETENIGSGNTSFFRDGRVYGNYRNGERL